MANPLDFPLNTLREMVIAGMERGVSSLNQLLDSPVELEIPSVTIYKPDDLSDRPNIFGEAPLSCVRIGFSGPVAGTAFLLFTPLSAAHLVANLVGQNTAASLMNGIMTETLNEVGNIIINGVIGTIGNILKQSFVLTLPLYLEGRLSDLLKPEIHSDSLTVLLFVSARFKAKEWMIDGTIFLIFEVGPGAPAL